MSNRKNKVFNVTLSSQWHIDFAWGFDMFHQWMRAVETNTTLTEDSDSEATRFIESTIPNSADPSTPTKIRTAVVPLKGVMMLEDTMCQTGALSLAQELNNLYLDESVNEIALEVNSGGGQSDAGYVVQNAIANRNKPVKAWVHLAGSAAYNAIVGCDGIYPSNKSAQLGSIGSLYSINKKMVEQYKEEYDDIYAKQSAKKNYAERQYMQGNKEPLFKKATEGAQMFIDTVHSLRDISTEVDTGEIFSAEKAISIGLADEIITSLDSVIKAEAKPKTEKKFLNKTSNVMDINKLVSAVKGFFNVKEEKTADELAAMLDATTLSALIQAEVAKNSTTTTEASAAVNSTLQELSEKLKGFEGMSAQLTALSQEVATLKTTTAGKDTKIVALEAQVLKLKDDATKVVEKTATETPEAEPTALQELSERVTMLNGSKY